MPWLGDPYPQINWGGPPDFRAAPIEGMVALRQQQQQQFQKQLINAIQQYQRDRVANALTQQYAQEDLIPPELSGMGAAGAGAAADYIRAQQYKTYPTQIGDQTYPLTQDERVKLAIAGAHINAQGAAGGAYDQLVAGAVPDPSGNTQVLGRYGRNNVWYPLPQWMQPGAQQSKQDAVTAKRQQQIMDDLDKTYGLSPDFAQTSKVEYGTASPDPDVTGIKKGRIGSNFNPTKPGQTQDWVRITQPTGAQTIMRRNDFEKYQKALTRGSAGVNPADVAQAAAAQGLGPNITPTPIPGATVNRITPQLISRAQQALADPEATDAEKAQAQAIINMSGQ